MNTIKMCGILAAGAVIGVLLSCRYFDKKYSDRADAEINQVIDEVNKRIEEMGLDDISKKDSNEEENIEPEKNDMLKNYTSDSPKYINYAKNDSEERLNDIRKATEPYQISSDEFIAERREYSKVTLLYFEDDDTLCDVGYELVEPDNTIGQDNLDMFAESPLEDGYFRNEAISTDFEVTKDEGSYKDYIGGDDI